MKRLMALTLIMLLCAPCATAEETASIIFGNTISSGDSAPVDMVFVSPGGDDFGDGSIENPLQTLHEAVGRALDAVSGDFTIYLREGTYYFDELLAITGSTNKRITIRAYLNEEPILTGAQRIDGWQETTFLGQTVWVARCDAKDVRALYNDTGALSVSRWPKNGYFFVAGSSGEIEDKFSQHDTFYGYGTDIPPSAKGSTIRLLHWWKDELSQVAAYDLYSGRIQLNRRTSMAIEQGDKYWFENILSVALMPGEWAYDANQSLLYYHPMEGDILGSTALYAGTTEQLLYIGGTSNITFDRITFARTGWEIPNYDRDPDFPQAAYDAGAAVVVQNAQNVTFTSCTFRDIGATCIRFNSIAKDITVYNCRFSNIGAHAVYVHGENTPYADRITERIVIENNEITGYGRNFLNATAILIIHARDVDISFNDIHDGTYTAISAGWVWGDDYSVTDFLHIRNNALHDIGQGMLSDMGAIYLLGNQPNTVVSGNIIHNVISSEYGGWGIYLDEGSSGILVEDNLVYKCSAQGFHQHAGSNNTVRNNIFALNMDGQVGASGAGSVLLQSNILVGGPPYLNIVNTVTVKQRDNLKKPDASIFVDAASGNFDLLNPSLGKDVGFVPWVLYAGRYGQYTAK